jgi:hypothetical protein
MTIISFTFQLVTYSFEPSMLEVIPWISGATDIVAITAIRMVSMTLTSPL